MMGREEKGGSREECKGNREKRLLKGTSEGAEKELQMGDHAAY